MKTKLKPLPKKLEKEFPKQMQLVRKFYFEVLKNNEVIKK